METYEFIRGRSKKLSGFGLSYTTSSFSKESKKVEDDHEQEDENQTGSSVNVVVKKEPVAAAAEIKSGGAVTRDGEDDQEALLKAEEMKEEDDEEMRVVDDMIDDGDCKNIINNGSSSSYSSDVLAKSMDGLNESVLLPPFLTKIFEMVEDPETDPIVSWSTNNDSLIVWDPYKFSENLLPKYFKHKNFSSFIRQLNTYGFRKIYFDRWEFANEGFQGGKKHLLKNIKRKRKYNPTSTNNIDLEAEIGNLKKGQSELKVEIMKLRQKQEESNDRLSVFKDRIRFAERRQQQMFNFVAKLDKLPSLLQPLNHKKQEQNKELDHGESTGKKRKLLETQVTKSSPEPSDRSVIHCENQVDQECWEPMQSDELPKLFHDIEKEFWEDQKMNAPEMSCVHQVVAENILGESSHVENATNEDLSVNDYKINLEFEGVIKFETL